jgi:hypothetical protein
MHSAKLTMAKFLPVLFVACGFQMAAFAQENSPYSRYGLGDLTPNHNIFTRGMGGVSAANVDYQSINFVNPASLGSITNTIFDVGVEAAFRTLKSTNPVKKFTSANSYFSYLQLGVPLATAKMRRNNIGWGLNFGLKPVTKINYKIEKYGRTGIDSNYSVFEGNGGINQAFVGTGVRVKNFSAGISAAYMFGNKDYSTRVSFINDTVTYYKSNSENKTTFGGVLLTAGLQYDIVLNDKQLKNKTETVAKILRLGVYGNLQQKLKANRDDIKESFNYDVNGGVYRIDSVYEAKNVKGNIDYPASFGGGFTYQDAHWTFGADYETTRWSNYKYYGAADAVQNNWIIRAGAQYYPAKLGTPFKKYFNFVKYRAGFYYGPDYIKTNNNRPDYAFTLGTGMPLSSLQRLGYNPESGLVMLNTALEIGGRGDKNTNVREGVVRFSIGISMSANWFIKRKYN